jgi:CRP-like cAMP-binding protein
MELADFPALQNLNSTQIENLTQACEERKIEVGEMLIHRGDDSGDLYFLLEGKLDVYVVEGGKEICLVQLCAPAIVGELELLTGQKRTANVRAVEEGRVMAIDCESVQARIDDADPAVLKVMYSISRVIAGRLASMSEKFVELEARADPKASRELSSFRNKLFSEWTF